MVALPRLFSVFRKNVVHLRMTCLASSPAMGKNAFYSDAFDAADDLCSDSLYFWCVLECDLHSSAFFLVWWF